MAFLWTEAQDGKKVKFDTPYNAQVFGKFDELIWKDADVIYVGIDKLKARKRLEMEDSYLISFATNSKGKHFVIVGPYGLRGGSINTDEEAKNVGVSQEQIENGLTKEQVKQMNEIATSILCLKEGAETQNIGSVVNNIIYLENIDCKDFLSPKETSIEIFCLLENEWIRDKSYFREVRRKFTQIPRKLLLWAYYNKYDDFIISKNAKDKVLEVADLIEMWIRRKQEKHQESGLLCDIREIKAVIECISNGNNWYLTLAKDGFDFLKVVFTLNTDSFITLLRDVVRVVRYLMRHKPSQNTLILEYLRKISLNNNDNLGTLFNFYAHSEDRDWELKYIVLDNIEAIILDEKVNIDIRKRCWNYFISILGKAKKKSSGLFQNFDNYNRYIWRIRGKIASAVVKTAICDNEDFKKQASEIIKKNMDDLDEDERIKYIWRNEHLFQQPILIFKTDWPKTKPHFDMVMEKIEANHAAAIGKIEEVKDEIKKEFGDRFEEFKKQILSAERSQNKKIFMMGINALYIGTLRNTSNLIQKEDYESRGDIVQKIRDTSEKKSINGAAVQIAIKGKKGDRKKQVAIEFVKRYYNEFGLIWWIDIDNASQEQSIQKSYMEIASSLGVENINEWQDEAIRQIKSLLGRQEKPWLLIFHNAENRDIVEYYRPKSQGTALITSKNNNWDNVIPLAFDSSPQIPIRIRSRSSSHHSVSRNNGEILDGVSNSNISLVVQSIAQRRPDSAAAIPNAKRILVAVRIRKIDDKKRSNIRAVDNSILIPSSKHGEDNTYRFDKVFKNNEYFPDIFNHTVLSLIQPFLSKNNVSFVTCGREKSGKTYIMNGITRLVFHAIFKDMDKKSYLRISYLSIYRTGIIDLLSDDLHGVGLEESSWFKPSTVAVTSEEDAMERINRWKSRRQEEEKYDQSNSLGHTVLQIELMEDCSRSKFLLVDFDGSEKNESFIAFGRCLEAISSQKTNIPYKSSEVTKLLRDFFDENCKNVMILNISSSDTNYNEIENCLKLAENATNLNLR